MKKITLCLALIFPLISWAQTIPSAQRVDWSKAGMTKARLQPSTILDITSFGAVANDTVDDFPAIDSAISTLNGSAGVIYFPAGNYLLRSTISLNADSIVIRGAGSDSTTLSFNFSGTAANSFHIGNGLTQPFYPIDSGYQKDSRQLTVNNAGTFLSAGDNIEIREGNGAWDIQPASWASYSVGHFSTVDSVKADTVWLNEALRLDFDSLLNPEIRKITPRELCGFECFKMVRVDTNSNGINYGFDFANASNCWMRGIESERSICAHVSIDRSSHLSITGCYFHDSYLYDGTSTRGYGVMIIAHSSANLVEDNIFKHLRHAMIAKQGANGNVFAYNYSIEPNRSEPIADYGADLCLHGHFAFANLFEGNIAQNLQIDIVWGPSGPYNTFFRNKIELYGIIMSSGSVQSNGQNFVGNDVSSSQILQGNYSLTGSGHFQYGNNIKGTITPAGTGSLADISYYLDSIPPFFWNIPQPLPSVGVPNTFITDNNPARQRYLNGGTVTRCAYIPYVDTTVSGLQMIEKASPFEITSCTAAKNRFTLTIAAGEEMKAEVKILSVTGQLLAQQGILLQNGISTNQVTTPWLSSGIYFVQLSAKGKTLTRKVILEGN